MKLKLALQPHGDRQWVRVFIRLAFLTLVFMSSIFAFTRMPGSSFSGTLPPLSPEEQQSAEKMESHVYTLAQSIGQRNIWTPRSMEASVIFLQKEFESYGYTIKRQEYKVYETTSLNLEVEIPGSKAPDEIVVVGAHYDTVPGCPGANDNGSGVAALLELGRLLSQTQPERTIRLVAFANEEAPFYFSRDMGSRRYAARCKSRKEKIAAMISLETIGFYSDEPGTQQYPLPFSFFYPDTANFIAFVGNIRSRHLVRQVIGSFRIHARFPSEGLAAPGFITGVGWSDHWSFWKEGYPAIMVTDTAFFRYDAYHTPADTAEQLDYKRMARVVRGLVPTLLELARKEY